MIAETIESGGIPVVGVATVGGVLWHTVGLREAGHPEIALPVAGTSINWASSLLATAASAAINTGVMPIGKALATEGRTHRYRLFPIEHSVASTHLSIAARRWNEVAERSGVDPMVDRFAAVQMALVDGEDRLPHEPGHSFAGQMTLYAAHPN